MCNDYRLLTDAATIFSDFSELKVKIRFPEGKPNPEAREDIKITDTAPIVRTINGEPQAAIWCNADGVGRGAASASTSSARTDASSRRVAASSQRTAFTSSPSRRTKKKKREDERPVHEKLRALVLHRLASGGRTKTSPRPPLC